VTRPVRWSRAALDHLKEQVAFIAIDNREAARKVAARINETALALGERAVGRPGRVSGTSEKRVIGLPYVIAYSVSDRGDGEVIYILRVIHTARDWPNERWPT